MKKVKLFLTATTILAVVGGTFAFKAAQKAAPDLYICNDSKVCALDPTTFYSDVNNGTSPITNPPALYKGLGGLGQPCASDQCQQIPPTTPVFDNN